MLVMVVFFIAFRWIHLSTPLIRLFLLVLILLLMPTLNFLPVWFALSLLRFRLPSRLPMMFVHRRVLLPGGIGRSSDGPLVRSVRGRPVRVGSLLAAPLGRRGQGSRGEGLAFRGLPSFVGGA